MGPETVVTLVGVAVIVGALAVYLIIIAGILVKVSSNLNEILNRVILDIANKTGGLRGVVESITNDIDGIERTMASLLPEEAEEEEEGPTEPEDEVPPPRRRRARAGT